MWTAKDADGNGFLDKAEAKSFIEELQAHMKEERKDNYSPENFEKIFAQFDTDQNGYLEKAELAVLIKKVFKKSLA